MHAWLSWHRLRRIRMLLLRGSHLMIVRKKMRIIILYLMRMRVLKKDRYSLRNKIIRGGSQYSHPNPRKRHLKKTRQRDRRRTVMKTVRMRRIAIWNQRK